MKRAAPAEKSPHGSSALRRKPKNTTTQQGCHSKSLRLRGATRRETGSAGRPRPARAASDDPRPFEFCVHLIDALCVVELKQTKWPRSRRRGVNRLNTKGRPRMQEKSTLLWPLMVNYGSHIHHLLFLPLTECIIFNYAVDFVHGGPFGSATA